MMKWLCIGAALLTWPLIPFGAFVRLKNAGLSCPDWPLCYGQLIPPPGFEIALETGHRFVATLLGILIIIITVKTFQQPAFRRYRKLAVISLILVCIQGILGALTEQWCSGRRLLQCTCWEEIFCLEFWYILLELLFRRMWNIIQTVLPLILNLEKIES